MIYGGQNRADALRCYYLHLAAFVGVNTLLVVRDVADGGGYWFYWTTIGWGIGMILHTVSMRR